MVFISRDWNASNEFIHAGRPNGSVPGSPSSDIAASNRFQLEPEAWPPADGAGCPDAAAACGVDSEEPGDVEGRPAGGGPSGAAIVGGASVVVLYLHHVLDKWWVQEVVPRLRGKAILIRYADDFTIGFELEENADEEGDDGRAAANDADPLLAGPACGVHLVPDTSPSESG